NNWTIQKLSEMSRISPAGIYKIETGTMTPSVTTMLKIARALGKKIDYFISDYEPVKDVELLRKNKRKKIKVAESGFRVERIAGKLEDCKLLAAVFTMRPGGRTVEEPISHTGEELVFCIDGKLEFTLDGKKYILTEGDSIHYKTEAPHMWKNIGRTRARMLFVMTPTPLSAEMSLV
ncbi:MAG: XRE family transcriptional regulator, partial [bacterium]